MALIDRDYFNYCDVTLRLKIAGADVARSTRIVDSRATVRRHEYQPWAFGRKSPFFGQQSTFERYVLSSPTAAASAASIFYQSGGEGGDDGHMIRVRILWNHWRVVNQNYETCTTRVLTYEVRNNKFSDWLTSSSLILMKRTGQVDI